MSIPRTLVALVLLGPLAVGCPHAEIGTAADEPPDMPNPRAPRGYRTRTIEGWPVVINTSFLRGEPDLADRTLKLLGAQLYQITRVVPPEALAKLRTIPIWVEEDEPHHPCMAYHPDPNWLREHGMSPEKARCAEIADARAFLEWTILQPWMVLHELSHGCHHQFLDGGYDNAEVKRAYDRAMRAGLYASVLRSGGREERAYAATNPMEYFAELTEAYFGTNDFYPFVRAELQRHDARAVAMLGSAWGIVPDKVREKGPPRPIAPKGRRATRDGARSRRDV